jgi:hypothetical protein
VVELVVERSYHRTCDKKDQKREVALEKTDQHSEEFAVGIVGRRLARAL